ncbi:MAG: glycosyltransferase family 39 protein [Nevskiales bacterium]|nr:glycosyltransferase family 39 protein [Nevskiales bacterium]
MNPALRNAALLAALAFIGFWIGSWQLPLFDLDEGAFSQATLEMLDSGNYLTTTLDGEPRYDKPMLSYWLQGLAVTALGPHEFAFRLPSMLAASLWMLMLFGFVRARSQNQGAAWLAAAALALSPMPSIIGHAATADAILDLLLTAALLDIYRHFESGRRAPVLRAYLWMGLGVLTKGPVAIAIPLLVSLLYALWDGRWRQWLGGVFEWRGWLILLAVVLPWGVMCWQSDGGEFIRHFLFDHNLGRYQNTLQGHGGKPYYYLIALPVIVWPFVALLPGALKQGLFGGALERFCIVWFATVFVLFSFSGTQLPHYLLYGATPLFVLFGLNAHRLPARGWLLAPGWILLALFVALPWILPMIETPPKRAWEAGVIAEAIAAFGPGYHVLSIAALAIAILALRLRPLAGLLTTAAMCTLTLWLAVGPVLAAAQQEPTRQAALRARALGLPAVRYATYLPTFSVYRGAPTPGRLPQPGELAFVRADKLAQMQSLLGDAPLREEYRKGGVVLVHRLPPADAP